MKKVLLIFILTAVFTAVKSQSLVNTKWFGTNPPSINLYFRFDTDTLYYSTGSGYTPLSLFTSVSGQFTIADLTGISACTNTGHYNYSIVGNNLIFTLIGDSCVSRINTLVNYNWTLISMTDIKEMPESSNCIVFPNPSDDGIFNLTITGFIPGMYEIILYDINGRKVFNVNLEGTTTGIDISFLPRGIYTGYYRSDTGINRFKIVR